METQQSPHSDGTPKPQTLISALRCALAERARCEPGGVVSRMWEMVSCTGFDEVDEDMMGKIVWGEEVGRGMKRIF